MRPGPDRYAPRTTRAPRGRWGATETWRGEEYLVRAVTGERATKAYRCPGCDHEIAVGVPHRVVWRAEGLGGADERRHWHTPCWARRHGALR